MAQLHHPRPSAGDIILPMKQGIPAEIRPLFWDVDVERIDLERNADYVISRILE